jgi:hypothetical protein
MIKGTGRGGDPRKGTAWWEKVHPTTVTRLRKRRALVSGKSRSRRRCWWSLRVADSMWLLPRSPLLALM